MHCIFCFILSFPKLIALITASRPVRYHAVLDQNSFICKLISYLHKVVRFSTNFFCLFCVLVFHPHSIFLSIFFLPVPISNATRFPIWLSWKISTQVVIVHSGWRDLSWWHKVNHHPWPIVSEHGNLELAFHGTFLPGKSFLVLGFLSFIFLYTVNIIVAQS